MRGLRHRPRSTKPARNPQSSARCREADRVSGADPRTGGRTQGRACTDRFRITDLTGGFRMTKLLTPADLRKISSDEDMARAKKAIESQRKDEEERAGLLEIFMTRDLHPKAKARVNEAIRRAAEQGSRHLLAITFPASHCNDKGRRINNLEPDWPDSL